MPAAGGAWNGQGGYAGGHGGSSLRPRGGDGESHAEPSDNTGLGGGGGGAAGRVRFNATTTALNGIVSPDLATGLATAGLLVETTTPLFFISDGGADGGEADAGLDADGGLDAGDGFDAGAPDGGTADGGVPVHHDYSVGCGCQGVDGGVGLLLLAALSFRRRRGAP
ncbi:MAG: hypothetical protein IT380_27755 [Myxococcales bacterium]|nr:hypothetical protein [Myxococcales bacterium]